MNTIPNAKPNSPTLLYFTDGEASIESLNNHIRKYNSAVKAIKENNITALSDTITYNKNNKLEAFSQEEINKLFTEAWLLQNMDIVQYLSGKNSSQYIAEPHYYNESVVKHLCKSGNLPALQLFIEMYDPNLSAQGMIHKLNDLVIDFSSNSLMSLWFTIDTPFENEYDAFMYAVKNNHVHIMDYLNSIPSLKDSIQVNMQKSLEIAATQKNTLAFDYLLDQQPENIDYTKILILSVAYKSYDTAKMLIEKNLVDINSVIISEKENLINYFASVYTMNNSTQDAQPVLSEKEKYSALSLACKYDNIEFIDYLLNHNAHLKTDDFLALSEVKNIDTAKHLIVYHDLPNDVAVNKKLHENFSTDDYGSLVEIMESRDLANELQHDLPITSSNKPKSKI